MDLVIEKLCANPKVQVSNDSAENVQTQFNEEIQYSKPTIQQQPASGSIRQPANSQSNIQPQNMQMQYNQPYQGNMQPQNMQYQNPNIQYQNIQPQNMQMQSNMPYNPYQNPNMQYQNMQMQQNMWQAGAVPPKPNMGGNFDINDSQTSSILNNISLSDGSSLMNKIKQDTGLNDYSRSPVNDMSDEEILKKSPLEEAYDSKPGLLEGAMEAAGIDVSKLNSEANSENEEQSDFDDISLLSESFEAQEKFRQYVVSELSKKNLDLTPQGNEFKLDISERTINMIARTVAKKIAKNVTAILTGDSKNSPQLAPLRQENEKLVKKNQELEEQNRKLRLLLTESNKNLNLYKPTIFGLYRRVKPKK